MERLSEALQIIKDECKKYKLCTDNCPLYDGYECMVQKDHPEIWDVAEQMKGE